MEGGRQRGYQMRDTIGSVFSMCWTCGEVHWGALLSERSCCGLESCSRVARCQQNKPGDSTAGEEVSAHSCRARVGPASLGGGEECGLALRSDRRNTHCRLDSLRNLVLWVSTNIMLGGALLTLPCVADVGDAIPSDEPASDVLPWGGRTWWSTREAGFGKSKT